MKRPTISDSRVQERFQRSCWRMNWRNVVGTAVCETAFASYFTLQSRSTQLVSERSSPKVDWRPRKCWFSHHSSLGMIASRRYAEKQPEQHVTVPKIDSAALLTRKATK